MVDMKLYIVKWSMVDTKLYRVKWIGAWLIERKKGDDGEWKYK